MITYTKKNLIFLVLSLTILIFLICNLVVFPFVYSKFIKTSSIFLPQTVYSKTIPIIQTNLKDQKTSDFQDNLKETNNIEELKKVDNQEQIEQQNTKSTQKQVIKDNKTNKWRIQIPKINLDVHIMEGTTSNILLEAVGHFEETSKWQGNVGLAAHNRGYQCNFFQKIKNLSIGDEIIYTVTNGKKVYKVQENKVILDTDWSYLEKTADNRITLITCEENRPGYRRCIQGIEIANYNI